MRVPDRRGGARGGALDGAFDSRRTTLEQAAVSSLRMDVCTTLGQGDRALAVGLDYLRRLGIDWSPHPTDEEARRAYDRIWAQLRRRRAEELVSCR